MKWLFTLTALFVMDVAGDALLRRQSQPPSCVTSPRLDAQAAQDAATQYCQNLIDSKAVLSGNTQNPAPGIQQGKTENGGSMALAVMFDQSLCSPDQSTSTLDFAAMGLDNCVENLYTNIQLVCSQDSTWVSYDPQWTLLGGTFGASCGLFSLYGQ